MNNEYIAAFLDGSTQMIIAMTGGNCTHQQLARSSTNAYITSTIKLWGHAEGQMSLLFAKECAMRLVAGLPIDLNRATAGDLELLDGIGPKLAAAVVAYREADGPFLTVDDLVLVRGIGPASLAKLKPYVAVSFDR